MGVRTYEPNTNLKNNNKKTDRDEHLKRLAQQVPCQATRIYILNEVLEQRRWYADKSKKAQKKYMRWMIVASLFTALVPVLTLLTDLSIAVRIVIAALTSAVAFVNTYLLLHNAKGLWLEYRFTSEALRRHLILYFNRAGIYAACQNEEERDRLLVETCEGLMAKENADWLSNMKQP